MERSVRWLIQGAFSAFSRGRAKESHEKSVRIRGAPYVALKPEHPDYEVGVQTTRHTHTHTH